jgi:hypothetical protein
VMCHEPRYFDTHGRPGSRIRVAPSRAVGMLGP